MNGVSSPKCALVIDDSRSMRRIISDLLRTVGFEVATAEDGKVALDVLKASERPALIIVDWNMPEMNGIEFIAEIRKDSAYDAVPVMMVTTEAEKKKVIQALTQGANEYLMKPFTREMMIEKLAVIGFEGL